MCSCHRILECKCTPEQRAAEVCIHCERFKQMLSQPEPPRLNYKEAIAVQTARISYKQRTVQNGYFDCGAAGFGIECRGTKCKAHVVTRKVHLIKAEPLNILIICKAHEAWFNNQPLSLWYRFLKHRHPDHFQWVASRVNFILPQLLEYIKVAEEGGDYMSDTYRKEYAPLTDEQKAEMLEVKEAAEGVEKVLNKVVGTGADPRLVATAKTYLEIAILLAVKGITAPRPTNQAAPVPPDEATVPVNPADPATTPPQTETPANPDAGDNSGQPQQ